MCRIGELSLLKNMMDTMEILGVDPDEEVGSESKDPEDVSRLRPLGGSRSQFQAITAGPESPQDFSKLEKLNKKRKGLTPEQKERLEMMQKEQEMIRVERVSILSKKLLDKISVWAETDRSDDVTEAFKRKIQVVIFSTSESLIIE